MSENQDNLIKTIIKGRVVTYYLSTEENLDNIKNKSVLGDIFTILTSLFAGGIISVIIIKATAIELNPATKNILDLLNYIFIFVTIFFGCFAGYFIHQGFNAIKKIKGSGEVKSFKSVEQKEDSKKETEVQAKDKRLEIIKAIYGTQKAEYDVTEELNNRIVDNKLEIVASNEIAGDPDPGTEKKLIIQYRINGITITKEFREHVRVIIT